MISYETPLGEALLGLTIVSKVQMPSGDSAILVAIETLLAELLAWLNSSPEQENQ